MAVKPVYFRIQKLSVYYVAEENCVIITLWVLGTEKITRMTAVLSVFLTILFNILLSLFNGNFHIICKAFQPFPPLNATRLPLQHILHTDAIYDVVNMKH